MVSQVPRLIDEWQLVPAVWNAVRYQVDERQTDGQFILTGSATPADDITRHTGAGRVARVRMGPMTLHEAGHGTGAVSLTGLFDGDKPSSFASEADVAMIAELVCRGGWPGNLHRDLEDALDANRDYLTTIASADIMTVDGVRRDPRKVTALLYALARSNGTYVTDKTLRADVNGRGETLAPKTLTSYLDALCRLWIVESLVFRDLSAHAQAARATVHAYQESSGAEIDAVVVRDDQWIGIEVKLGARPEVVDPAAAGLLRIAGNMRTPPSALVVVTATGASYRREDGVDVVSILDLAP
ncbi:ATP-binding protein [Cellulomonas soli]|uniref:ATPase n=1 Tax=Cellulomonas soli TaxID=931535 RepID=A0A512PCA2_9CELL|nr:DUF4143 domain-containing protein [Cellulomonas soli]NYI58419.1 hypothetical protein [Cellulomonas soli]GEP68841.1 ATPase [Cellulomonas soli]